MGIDAAGFGYPTAQSAVFLSSAMHSAIFPI